MFSVLEVRCTIGYDARGRAAVGAIRLVVEDAIDAAARVVVIR